MDKTASITGSAQSIFMDVTDVGSVCLMCAGTFAGVNCTFEASLDSTDGIAGTWFGIQALRSNANLAEAVTGVLGAAPAYCWEVNVSAYKYLRIRSTAWTSGTQIWTMRGYDGAAEGIPCIPLTGYSNTVTPLAPTSSFTASAASTNATVVKGSAGTVYHILATNQSAAAKSVKLYNKATSPTVGTDQPVATIQIPANSQVNAECGALGIRFGIGIAFAITGLPALGDTTAVAVNDVELTIAYT
jgi:hypothetical protein